MGTRKSSDEQKLSNSPDNDLCGRNDDEDNDNDGDDDDDEDVVDDDDDDDGDRDLIDDILCDEDDGYDEVNAEYKSLVTGTNNGVDALANADMLMDAINVPTGWVTYTDRFERRVFYNEIDKSKVGLAKHLKFTSIY
jgi:hypothetical protein